MTRFAPKTDRARVRFVHSQRVSAAPQEVFPLLCPVRELDWVPGWDCRLVYSASGLAEDGCVFQTDRPADGGLDTWVVSRYEPPLRISFVRSNALRVMHYDIRLVAAAEGGTTLEWEQVITALGDDGDRHVAALEEQDFVTMIAALERMLEHYLHTGEALAVAS
jgi:hypothetical protein